MASVDITISGVLYDKIARTTQPVVLIGEATLTGVGIGGGPIYPPPGGGEKPPGIWGGGGEGFPTPPIYIPPIVPVPPDSPHVPPPGSPPTIVQGTHPANPMTPPPAVIIEYPGIGKVVVPQPLAAAPK